jgi:hypothetical protein
LADDQDVQQAVERLQAKKTLDRNLGALGRAIIEIRNDAEECRRLVKRSELVSSELTALIEKIIYMADSLHNVPTFMVAGIPCDAQYLSLHGVDANWPTGIPDEPQVCVK